MILGENAMARRQAEVTAAFCVACGACANECPRQAISIVKGCYADVNTAICVGCGKCEKICPANAISLKEKKAV